MIQLRDGMPMVQFPDGRVVAFDKGWLAHSLACAGQKAGYDKWWLVEHVAQSVTSYLLSEYEAPLVPVLTLDEAVRSALKGIGCDDVADVFAILPPPFVISLDELAQVSGAGYELAFFAALGKKIREAVIGQAAMIQLHDAHICVKTLRGAKHWRHDCAILLDEIVTFVRNETFRLAGHDSPHPLYVQLL